MSSLFGKRYVSYGNSLGEDLHSTTFIKKKHGEEDIIYSDLTFNNASIGFINYKINSSAESDNLFSLNTVGKLAISSYKIQDFMRLADTQTITGQKTFNNLRLNTLLPTQNTNKFTVLDDNNQLVVSTKSINDWENLAGNVDAIDLGLYCSLGGIETITGEKTFNTDIKFTSNLGFVGGTSDYLAVFAMTNNETLRRHNKRISDFVDVSTTQTINGVKTFDELKLAYSCQTYTDANRNLVAFGNGNDFLLKSVYKINDFLRLADDQTITGKKTYTNPEIYFTNLNSGSASTDRILVMGGDNSFRNHTTTIGACLNSNVDFSNYTTLNSTQTITGQKTFNAKTYFNDWMYNPNLHQTDASSYIMLWYKDDGHIFAHNTITKDKLVLTDNTQTISGTKTFSGTVNLTSQNTYLTNAHTTSTGTHPIACIGATDGRISKTSITQGNVCTTNTTQTITGEKIFDTQNIQYKCSEYTGTDRNLVVYGRGNDYLVKSSYQIGDLLSSAGTWHTNLISDTCDSIILSDYNSTTFFVIRLGKIYFFRRMPANSSLTLYHGSINAYDYNTSKIIMYYQRNPTDAFYPYIGGAIEYGSSRIRLFDGGNITHMDNPAVKSFAVDETGTRCWAVTHSRTVIEYTKFTYPVAYSTKPGNLDDIDMSRDGNIIVGHNGTTVYYWWGSNWGSLGTFGTGSLNCVSVDNDGIIYACDSGNNLYKYVNGSWSFVRDNCARVNYKNGVLTINTSSWNVELLKV